MIQVPIGKSCMTNIQIGDTYLYHYPGNQFKFFYIVIGIIDNEVRMFVICYPIYSENADYSFYRHLRTSWISIIENHDLIKIN